MVSHALCRAPSTYRFSRMLPCARTFCFSERAGGFSHQHGDQPRWRFCELACLWLCAGNPFVAVPAGVERRRRNHKAPVPAHIEATPESLLDVVLNSQTGQSEVDVSAPTTSASLNRKWQWAVLTFEPGESLLAASINVDHHDFRRGARDDADVVANAVGKDVGGDDRLSRRVASPSRCLNYRA
jgi:hypothetical protein